MKKNNDDANKILGKRLRYARNELKLTQDGMCELLNYQNRNSISDMERGRTEISKDVAKVVANKLGWDVNFLIDVDCIYKNSQERFNDKFDKEMELSDSVRKFYNEVGIYTWDSITVPDEDDETSRRVTHFIMKLDDKYRKITTREYLDFEKRLCDYAIFEFQHMGKPYTYDN